MNSLLSEKQKMWMAVLIGIISQSIAIVAAVLTEGTTKTVLLVIGAIVGVIGSAFGVYKVVNKATV